MPTKRRWLLAVIATTRDIVLPLPWARAPVPAPALIRVTPTQHRPHQPRLAAR